MHTSALVPRILLSVSLYGTSAHLDVAMRLEGVVFRLHLLQPQHLHGLLQLPGEDGGEQRSGIYPPLVQRETDMLV